ncbi:MAG: phosphotransferase family protein [Nocardioides sp.]
MTPDQLAGVAGFLVERGEEVAGPLTATLLTGGRSNLTYRLDDGRSAWVLRRPPTGGVIESAHDMEREHRVVASLQGTGVPVARSVGCDRSHRVLDAPYAVTAFVTGRTVRSRDDLAPWSDAEVAACVDGLLDALVALHAVDPTAVGLGDLGRPDGYAARQLRRWSTQWEAVAASNPGAGHRVGALVDVLRDRLPAQARSCVVHGDYRVDNTILDAHDPGRVLAVVDWELSTLGDPAADLALMAVYRHPALDGILGIEAAWTSDRLPGPDALRTGYEDRTGAPVDGWDVHLGLAFLKLAVIAAGITHRARLGVTSGEGYEGVAATVPVLLDAGLEAAAARTR